MAPPGPPPYSLEQINAMTSKEERLRARAELKSYIARLRKEKEEQVANQLYNPDRCPHGQGTRSNHSRNHASTGAESSGVSGFNYPGSFRGGYGHRGRAHASFHPYSRSSAAQPFKNRSITFNHSDASAESSDAGDRASPRRRHTTNQSLGHNSRPQLQVNSLCAALTSTGLCTRHGCRYIHDPNKQALCKRWLYKDDCPMGDRCSLSHHATSNNAPTCLHFQAGRCTNEPCRFAHIRVSDSAQNCEAFGQIGYCEKGEKCGELHAHECPAFANTGACQYGNKCRLGHVYRASRMRKASRPSSAERTSHSPRGESLGHIDATEDNEVLVQSSSPAHKSHQFTQQEDFVRLDEAD